MTIMDLLGSSLLKGKDTVDTAKAFEGAKAVGLYFSAHWCPPCRGFTPKLVDFYTKDLKDKGLEIVFISSDKDEEAFNDYYKEQPWLALPFDSKDIKSKLDKKFKVSGIPSLVIVDTEGNLITDDGRSAVSADPTGQNLPWKPKTFAEIMEGAKLVGKDGKQSSWADLAGKTVGFYFSAHWCPPCRGFTPNLCKTYSTIVADGKPFEIIFVSSDRDKAAFEDYHKDMPFLALDYDDRARKDQLNTHFGVNGIPHLVLVDDTGSIVRDQARGAVDSDPDGADFPWPPKPVNSMDDPDGINDTPSVCILMEKVPKSEQGTLKSALMMVAKPILSQAKADGEERPFCFFIAESDSSIASKVRSLTNLGEAVDGRADVVLLDCADGGTYYKMKTEKDNIKESDLNEFIKAFKDASLEKKTFA